MKLLDTFLCTLVIVFESCTCKAPTLKTTSTILQDKVDSILMIALKDYKAISGKAIIMETSTGYIKAMAGLERKDTLSPFQPTDDFYTPLPTGLKQVATILAALETGKINYSDTIDVKDGIYITESDTIKDHNWYKGGYGKITVEQVIAFNSRVGEAMIRDCAFDNKKSEYEAAMRRIGYGRPDSIKGMKFSPVTDTDIQKTAPIQLLAFYNAIANHGCMVQPQLHKDSTVVISPFIATKANINNIRQALEKTAIQGLEKRTYTDKIKIAGKGGTTLIGNPEDSTYIIDFCGYFPADTPQYTVLVILQKQEQPVSGNISAAKVFKNIVNQLKNN